MIERAQECSPLGERRRDQADHLHSEGWASPGYARSPTSAALEGKKIEYPRLLDVTFKKAAKARKTAEEQMPLGGGEIEEPF